MPDTKPALVKQLSLDLSNFRTVPQADEVHAVQAMVAINPDWFWALMESLIDDGYLPTENILVLRAEEGGSKLIVKEGNRRIAALKLVHGYLPDNIVTIPDNLVGKISGLSSKWKADNRRVPCTIYASEEAPIVDRIVTLAHGKGEKAGRQHWNAVARARHKRDANKVRQPALDILEIYLREGRNLTLAQAERWSGEYPLTVLEEAIKRIATRFGANNSSDLAKKYPAIQYKDSFDDLLKDIGLQIVRFEVIRNKSEDFLARYNVPSASSSHESEGKRSKGDSQNSQGTSSGRTDKGEEDSQNTTSTSNSAGSKASSTRKKVAAVAIHDPRAVMRALRNLKPTGGNRQKVVTLRDEALALNLNKNPLAFCFLLRSMFEISAKAYCEDQEASGGPSAVKADGTDRNLVDVLRDVTTHLTALPDNKKDKGMVKTLHGAMIELGKPDGVLSVTSMNQLVHNPRFSVTATDISTMFGNILPLLELMN